MRVVRTVQDLRAALRPEKTAERSVGFVATMGALHDGHASLITAARRDTDVVVVSIFVNPTQFNDPSDLEAYPRTEEADLELAEQSGADYVFIPETPEMYPEGSTVAVQLAGELVDSLEGAHRGAQHFHGVTTVVTKLLNIVQPDIAYFGQKDVQQALVIRALVRDLILPVRVAVEPTVREEDGLAMSSRNIHLHGDDRDRALALKAGLDAAQAALADDVFEPDTLARIGTARMGEFGIVPEYFAVVDVANLAPIDQAKPGDLVVTAAMVGPVRLIDNIELHGRNRA